VEIKDKQAAYHDWEAATYDDKWSISFDERCIDYALGRFRVAVGSPAPFDRALEVGCGTGFFLLNLAQAGVARHVHCTDIAAGMVARCTANGAALGIPVQGRVADAERLPYQNATFDLVVGHAVLHHLPDVEGALAEMRRVLRPGGRLVIAGEPTRVGDAVARQVKRAARTGVKLAAVVLGADRVLRDRPVLSAPDAAAAALEAEVDLHTFRPDELERAALAAGFSEVAVHTEELTASWFGWATRTVEGMVGLDRLPGRYPWWAYRTWRHLFAFDRALGQRLVPDGWCYNAILTGTVPQRPQLVGA
jgi:ubiquinone/menaquinone biosynthesis C-methylase UbiE